MSQNNLKKRMSVQYQQNVNTLLPFCFAQQPFLKTLSSWASERGKKGISLVTANAVSCVAGRASLKRSSFWKLFDGESNMPNALHNGKISMRPRQELYFQEFLFLNEHRA